MAAEFEESAGSGCGDGSRPLRSVLAQIGRTWHRIGWVEGQDGCDDQVEKTKNGGSKCQSHRMTIDNQQRVLSNGGVVCGAPFEHMVCPYEYEEYEENSSDTGDTEEEENQQYVERTAGNTHDAGLQPSDTTELAGLGGMQGGIVVPLCVGHPVHVYGVVPSRTTLTNKCNFFEAAIRN